MTTNQLHRFLLDNLNTAVLLLDGQLLVEYLNPACEDLFKVSSTRLKGASAKEIFPGKDNAIKTLQQSLDLGRAHMRRHEFIAIYGAETVQVDYSVTPIELDSRKLLLMEIQPVDRFLKINREEAILCP